jgi:hypothetical protein
MFSKVRDNWDVSQIAFNHVTMRRKKHLLEAEAIVNSDQAALVSAVATFTQGVQ